MKGKKPDRSYRPQLEALEGRELPAATVSLQAGLLSIVGDGRADTVVVTQENGLVRVRQQNGAVRDQVFAAAGVSRIIFRGFDGDDAFINNSGLPSQAFGNRGRDVLQGSPGAIDQLFGGAGIDRLFGDTFDLLDGGPGRDRVFRDDRVGVLPNGSAATTGVNGLGTFDSTLAGALGVVGSGVPVTGALGSLASTTPGLTSLTGGLGSAATSPAISFATPIGTGGLSAAANPLTNQALSNSSVGALGNPLNLGSTFSGGLGAFF